jgi:hypothetical protein
MSSISLPNEKQIKHFFTFTTVASQTTPATFIASATAGQIQLFRQDGTINGKGSLYLLKKDLTGKVVKSDLIDPKNITYLKGTKPRAKTGKTQVFTMTTPVVGAFYNMTLKLGYAGSEENFEYIFATEKAVTGDTATTLMTRLAKQLGDNLAASIWSSTNIAGNDTIIVGTTVRKNKYFTLTQVAGALTITEKDWILDGYVPTLKAYDQLNWNAEIETSNEAAAAGFAKTSTAPIFATGQGYQMIEMEHYLVGHRAEFDDVDITVGFHRTYESVTGSSYNMLDLSYFDVPRNDPHRSDKQLFVTCTSALELDRLGFRIEAAMGSAEGTIWTELDPNADGSDNV